MTAAIPTFRYNELGMGKVVVCRAQSRAQSWLPINCVEFGLPYQKIPVKAKDYEFEKVRIHQRKDLCLDTREDFIYDWTT